MAEQWANSCSKADIEAAILIVKNAGGGTVFVPEGNAEHAGENIKVSGKVSIIGAGKGKSVIDRASGSFFNYDTRYYGGAGESPRFSGFTLQNLSSPATKSLQSVYFRGLNNFRMDNCHIKGYFSNGLHVQGSYGVVDHCDIDMMWTPSAYGIRITGYDDEWVEDINTLLGSYKAVFIEDCAFSGGGHQIASSGGATHYVLRHCTLNLAGSSAIDAHGPGWGPDFGTRCVEIYNNIVNRPEACNIGIRGGGGVIYNNTLNGNISLVLESGSSGDYPIPMQVHDLWIWNNDIQTIIVTSWGGTGGLDPKDYIKENRDYWLTQKSYTPYTYPHPLVVTEPEPEPEPEPVSNPGINVGSAAIDRENDADLAGYTFIAAENPANATGKINHIEIYIAVDTGTIEVASFYKTNGNTFSTRGSTGVLDVDVGLNVFNAPADFTAFAINAGDYIGVHGAGANLRIEQDPSGDGKWYKPGDYIPCTETPFSWLADRTVSLYATGTEEGAEEKVVSDSGAGSDVIAGLKAKLSISDAGSGVEVAATPYKELLISDFGSGIESIFGPPILPFYKELFIKRVNYRISPQGIKCDLELGELYLPLEQEILNILRDLKNEKELLQANTKQLSV